MTPLIASAPTARRTGRLNVGAALALALSLSACDGLLKVDNPAALQESQLENPALSQFLINGVIGEFQFAYGYYALWSGVLADESYADHVDLSIRALTRHEIDDLNTINDGVYGNLHRARQSAEDVGERLKRMLGSGAGTNLDVARALIYAGYSYVLLGEGFCESPVNGGPPLSSAELLGRAVARFEEGLLIASAALTGPNEGPAQDLIHLAHVGAARALLKQGDVSKARAHAALVPDGYERLAYYSGNSVRENNAVHIGAKTPYLGMHPVFQRLDDPRIPRSAAARQAIAGSLVFPPLKPFMYGGWIASAPVAIEVTTPIRFASGLEARYIGVEADGPGATMLSFVNARRAAVAKSPVSLGGAALLAEFRVQRALDFYLTGQRLGDLRRYAAAGDDLFLSGPFPVPPDSYGTRRCFIIPRSEKAGNPNL
jgi:hypothetical protein